MLNRALKQGKFIICAQTTGWLVSMTLMQEGIILSKYDHYVRFPQHAILGNLLFYPSDDNTHLHQSTLRFDCIVSISLYLTTSNSDGHYVGKGSSINLPWYYIKEQNDFQKTFQRCHPVRHKF